MDSEPAYDTRTGTQHREFFVVNNKTDRGMEALRMSSRQLGTIRRIRSNPPNPYKSLS